MFTPIGLSALPMKGPKAPRPKARLLLAIAATVAFGGAFGSSGQAQVGPAIGQQSTAALATASVNTGPTFQPSEQAAFEEAFAHLGRPAPATAVTANAVDVTEVLAAAPSASAAATHLGTGSASYYADRFHGQRTASGEAFDNRAYTAAHRTLPFGSRVRVTNPATGASVVVRINDRGPFTRGRLIDVSRAAAEDLGLVRPGHADVALELLEG